METELAINHRLLTLLYDVVGPMVVYYVLWAVLVYRLPATVVAIATLLTPIVGVSSAIFLLSDQIIWQNTYSFC